MDTTDGDDVAARRGIQSIEIGIGVLQGLAAGGAPMTLKEVSASAGLPPSNCHRYLTSFVRKGFVVQNERTGRYDLGPMLLQAGLAALGRLDPIGVATEAAEQLVDETGNAAMVSIWADAGPTIVRWIQGRDAVRTTLSPGTSLPLLETATGQIFLSFLPSRQTLALRSRYSVDFDVDRVVREVRAAGFANVSGDHIPGLNAAAAAVLDPAGEAAAAITLVTAGKPLGKDALRALRRHARAASGRLGYNNNGRSRAAQIDRFRKGPS